MSTTLDTDVRTLLESRRGDWLAIATTAKVSYSWISKFVNGHIPNPGYMTLVKLHDHLVAIPIDHGESRSTAKAGEGTHAA